MSRRFAEIDHSGDVGIEAWGKNLAELLENATLGLFSLMYRGTVEGTVERRLHVRSRSAEDLLVDWLSEVIAVAGAGGELFESVRVAEKGEYEVEGSLRGEKVDAAKHGLRFDVKAATYHGLRVENEGGLFHARVIFDL